MTISLPKPPIAPAGTPSWGIAILRDLVQWIFARAKLPVKLPEYTVATLPSASDFQGCWVAVSNETGGYTGAISDGTNWLRMQDRAIVS